MRKLNSQNIFVFKKLFNNKSNIIKVQNKFCFLKNQNFATKRSDGPNAEYLDQR